MSENVIFWWKYASERVEKWWKAEGVFMKMLKYRKDINLRANGLKQI